MTNPYDGTSAHELWRQAGGGTKGYSRERYHELAREHGLIRDLAPGETAEPLPCGWPGPSPELVAAVAEFDRLIAIANLAVRLRAVNPGWREGQAAFNALEQIDPACAQAVRGRLETDPFYQDKYLEAFWDFVTDWKAP